MPEKIILLFLILGSLFNIYRRKELKVQAEILPFQLLGFFILFALLAVVIFRTFKGQIFYYFILPAILVFFFTNENLQGYNEKGLFHLKGFNLYTGFSPWKKIKVRRVEYDGKYKVYRVEMIKNTSFQSFTQYYKKEELKRLLSFARADHIFVHYED